MAPFLTGMQVTAAKGFVCRAYAGSTWSVRGSYAERAQDVRSTRLQLGHFLRRSFSCGFLGGFDRLFEDFLVSSDSRTVRESPPDPRLAQPGWKPSHLSCPRVPAGRQAGSPWMETFPSELSEGSRWSSGWLTLDGVLPILFLALPLPDSLVRNCFVLPPLLSSPSFWSTWFTLRGPLLLLGLWGGCPGTHRVSLRLL